MGDDFPALMTLREVAVVSRREPATIRNRVYLDLEPQPVKRDGGRLLFRRDDVRRWLGLG